MINIQKDLILTDTLRQELAEPMGRVLECYEVLKELKHNRNLVTIGDSVSSFFIRQGEPPNLIIWDGNTKRQPIDASTHELLSGYAAPREVENPPGTLTKEAWDAVSSSLGRKKASVFVKGEEDLLALPAILNSRDGTYVVYGHPPGKGAILIVVSPKIRSLFEGILSRFDERK
jgi:GTP-dependent dephospho-CoA kinase